MSGGQIVNNATSSVSVVLTAGTDPSVYAQSLTFTATISGAYGTGVSGTVTWSSNTGCVASALSGNPGTATCTTSSLPVGDSDTVTAKYGGDGSHSGSSGSVNQTVRSSGTQAASTTAVVSSQNPSNFGQAVSFTANVTPASGGGTPTGTVQFAIDGTDFSCRLGRSPCSSIKNIRRSTSPFINTACPLHSLADAHSLARASRLRLGPPSLRRGFGALKSRSAGLAKLHECC